MERAVAYIRVSDKRQAEEGNSLASQERVVREYAGRKGYELGSVWIEEGATAKTANRPVLKELLKNLAIRRERPSVLIVPKIDRFARYVEDYAILKAKLRQLSIRLESVGENLEDTPVGRFNEMILAAAAQFDNEIRAERCKGGMVEAVKEGRWVWEAPLGYINVRIGKEGKKRGVGNIAPDPRSAGLVAGAFRRVAANDRQTEVRAWLESQGVKISPSAFGKILRNKAYVGVIEAFGHTYRAAPPFVPIVEEGLFREVQIALARGGDRTTRPYERDNPDFALRGTIKCQCGEFMTSCWAHGSRKRYPYYRCMTCERANYGREAVEDAFKRELEQFRPHPKWLESQRPIVQALWRMRRAEKPRRMAELAKALKELDDLSDALANQTVRGIVPEGTAKRRFEAIELERMELQQARDGYGKIEGYSTDTAEFAFRFLSDLSRYWSESALPSRKKLQFFMYPNGVVYTKNGNFRTNDNQLLEQVKAFLRSPEFSVVDPCISCPNQGVTGWLEALRKEFGFILPEGREE